MPVVLTFDIAGAEPIERNRIQSFFERFGWENLGGSGYRYPRLGSDAPVEDWMNHVIPALMLFRTYIMTSGRPLTKFTLDIQASTGFSPGLNGAADFGHRPENVEPALILYDPTNTAFGKQNMLDWLDQIPYPY